MSAAETPDPLPYVDGHGRRYAEAHEDDHCPKCSTTHAPRPVEAFA